MRPAVERCRCGRVAVGCCWLPEDIDTEQQDFLARLLGRQGHITAVGCGA